jgi:hypothetical protein
MSVCVFNYLIDHFLRELRQADEEVQVCLVEKQFDVHGIQHGHA